ncbi:Peroxisome assembly factor 2 [Halotydeus destructor]|nr:Peroxisome assembly factor 2 [Halotydeus destructor]
MSSVEVIEEIHDTYAQSVTAALVSSPNYPRNIDYANLLKSHFATPKVITLNDTLSIPTNEDLSIINQSGDLDRPLWSTVYFKIINIEGKGRLVDASRSKFFLSPGSLNSFVPEANDKKIGFPLQVRRHVKGFTNIVKPYVVEQFCDSVPVVMLSGPPGSGKQSLVNSVATNLGLHVHRVDVNLMLMDTPAATEAKLKIGLEKAACYAPCIILISNIEALCKEPSGNDARLAQAISDYLNYTSVLCKPWPIIAVMTTDNPDVIFANNEFGALVLHHYSIGSLTDKEKVEILNQFSEDFAENVNLKQLSRKMTGFVLGDILNLVSTASTRCNRSSQNGKLVMADLMWAIEEMSKNEAKAAGYPKIPEVKWEDVGGLFEAKQEILDTIQLPLKYPELQSCGLKRCGLLLYGPPGTGKTLLAKAVATECSLNFMSVKGPELINMYVGQSEQNVRDVFKRAREALPCVIFFDELDSLAPNRGQSSESGGVMDRVVSQLLVEMDGLNKSNQLFIIGATNRPDLLDPGLLRPGRFDRLVYVGIADEPDSRTKILQALTRKFNLDQSLDLCRLEQICPRFLTGADFYALCSSAMTKAICRSIQLIESGHMQETCTDNFTLTYDDFALAIDNFVPSVSIEELMRYEMIKKNMSS